tara:strand:- start:3396 stop:3665 length:270 start_codon:yes stop_codon:yes gene_type:complete
MRYKELVIRLAAQSGQTPKAVRDVLFSLPDILITLEEDDKVRMPFGSFRMTRRQARSVTVPTSEEVVEIPAEMVVKLKPGSRLRRKAPQ